MNAIDLFSGAGGWDVAAARLGVHPLGIECDLDAIATARAAGHRIHEGDVAALDPAEFAPCDLLIASPPCQAWSAAGKGGGQRDIAHVHAVTDWMTGRRPPPDREQPWADERSRLVCEPLRWALALEPRWIALEQVPPVLEYWRHLADVLCERGYSCWVGILSAETFGVAQTRRRAILMADRDAPVCPPRATHQRYVPGEPQRHEWTLEGEVLPWVSMAEALGRGAEAYRLARGEGMNSRYGERPDTPADQPAPTVTSKARTATWRLRGHQSVAGEGRAERAVGVPSLTVSTRSDLWSWRNGNQANAAVREQDQPAPTIHFGDRSNLVEWVAPDESGSQQRDAIRVSVEEAATLQSFPAGYPWQGSRTSQFRQVGNAIPPELAEAVLRALVGGRCES